MSADRTRRDGRPRLTPEDRARLLDEIARHGDPVPVGRAQQGATPKRRAPAKAAADPGPPAAVLRAALLGTAPAENTLPRVIDVWGNLGEMPVDPALLDRNLVISANRRDPAHAAFDVLRTRLVQTLADNGWRRVAVTSPTADCGKSFTAINLAIALSRYEARRTVLLDMDLRAPGLARYLGVEPRATTGDFLRGLIPAEAWLRRFAPNDLHIGPDLAIGLNGRAEDYAAELFQAPRTTEVMTRLMQDLDPDVVLFDLPPALVQDDVIAFRPQFDCVLMVVGGGMTTAAEVREAIRRIGEDKPVVGIVLNKSDADPQTGM